MSTAIAPSNAELALLKCLWHNEACSARELHTGVADTLGWSYSSTRKTLERMVDKGLVDERSEHGLNVYRARVGKVQTLAALSSDFARRVLELDGELPLQAFADSRLLTTDELDQLDTLLREGPGEGDEA